MGFLLWLENSALSSWVLNTTWAYPWVISFHSIGMAFLVGIVFIIGLRVLGFVSFELQPLQRFLPIVWTAFAINFASGVTLLAVDASNFMTSPVFLIKLACIVLGAGTSAVTFQKVFRAAAASPNEASFGNARAVTIAALVCWTGAILAGRLTAYV